MVAARTYTLRTHDDIEFDEYLQFAVVGMMEALNRFDPGRGARFATYAERRIQGSILDGIARLTEKNEQIAARREIQQARLHSLGANANGQDDLSAIVRARHSHPDELFRRLAEIGIGVALGVLLDGTGMIERDPAAATDTGYYRHAELRQLQQHVRELVRRLSPQEQSVIEHHYLQDRDFDEIASMLGVGRSRVSQIHRQALGRLRDELRSRRQVDASW